MTTIPASEIVTVTPSVLAAGGQAIDLNGLVLTNSIRPPIGTVQAFSSPTSVNSYFGATSNEASIAAVYFQGDDNSLAKPGSLLFAQYPSVAAYPYLRGASLGAMTLTQLQALSGSLSVVINGVTFSGSPSLASATSFAAAASTIESTLSLTGVLQASVTGQQGAIAAGTCTASAQLTIGTITGGGVITVGDTINGSGIPGGTTILSQLAGAANGTGIYLLSQVATVAGTASLVVLSTVLHITVVASGTVTLADVVAGTGVSAETFVSAQLSGTTGGVGFYTASSAQNYPSQALTIKVPGVQYDSVTNAFQINGSTTGGSATIAFATGSLSTALNLTQALGAVLSQGANAATPAAFMNTLITINQNWASFMLGFTADGTVAGVITNRLAFAQWVSGTNNRYVFVVTDSDASPTTSSNAPACLGQQIALAGYGGVIPMWQATQLYLDAFVMGWAASLDFTATNGRRTLAFRSQQGIRPAVTDQATFDNLIANNYNTYGIFGTGNENFTFTYDGGISGAFLWADSYVNQIWMNNSFQVDLMTLLTSVGSIPYNSDGNTLIEAGLGDTITQAGLFGVFRPGVTLSQSQITQVNNAAQGKNIAPTLQTRGWYLVINPTPPSVRAARGSPPCTFFYVDGQSVQQIHLSSIELQ